MFWLLLRYILVPTATTTSPAQARVICSLGVIISSHLTSASVLPRFDPSPQSSWDDPLQNSNHTIFFLSLNIFKALMVHRIMKATENLHMSATGLSTVFKGGPSCSHCWWLCFSRTSSAPNHSKPLYRLCPHQDTLYSYPLLLHL